MQGLVKQAILYVDRSCHVSAATHKTENCLQMNYRFKNITLFHFRLHLTYMGRGGGVGLQVQSRGWGREHGIHVGLLARRFFIKVHNICFH